MGPLYYTRAPGPGDLLDSVHPCRVVGITRIIAKNLLPLALLCSKGPLGWFWTIFPAIR